MAVTLSLFAGAGAQFLDNNGVILSGGLVYTYAAGTTTPLAAYTSNTGDTALANPIVLDAAGRVPTGEIWLTYGQGYKFTVKTSTNTLIGTYDNIPTAALPPLVNDAVSIAYEQGASVTAGNFIIGKTYLITFIGTTNFQSIGAVSNTVGIYFTATGVGTGTGTAELTRTVQAKLQESVSVKDFGAVADGTTDDTAAIQAAINAVASSTAAAGIILFPQGSYKISGTILFGAGISFNFDGSTLTGTSTGGNTMFESAYWTGSQMVSNISTGPENNRVIRSIIDGNGATITNCGKAFNLKNFNEVCEIKNIFFANCTQNIYSARPFYSRYVNLTTRGTANSSPLPAFYFSESSGACVWESLYVIDRVLGMEISGPSCNSSIHQCAFESCTDGLRFSGYTSGPATVSNNYFEFCSGIAIEFSGDDYVENIWVANNFYNTVGYMIKGRLVRNGYFINNNPAIGSVPGIIDIGDPFSPVDVKLNASLTSVPALPTYFLQPNRSVTPWQEERIRDPLGSGNIVYKNINQGLTTPFHYSGDCGESFNNLIPFCVATKVDLGAGNFSWTIDTQIVWRSDMIHAAYYFRGTDNSGTHKVGGVIMGDQVGPVITAAGRTVAVSNNGGFLRVTVSGFNHPTLAGFIYGYVKLI